jgi:hypothetical protein
MGNIPDANMCPNGANMCHKCAKVCRKCAIFSREFTRKNTRIQEFRNTRTQEFRNMEVLRAVSLNAGRGVSGFYSVVKYTLFN